MAQPGHSVPFHNFNAPFDPQQQRQRPSSASAQGQTPGTFNHPSGPTSAPHARAPAFQQGQYYQDDQQQQQQRQQQQHQQHQHHQQQPFYSSSPSQQQQYSTSGSSSGPGYNQFESAPQDYGQQQSLSPGHTMPTMRHHGHGHPVPQPGNFGVPQHPQEPDFFNHFSQNPMAGLAMNTASDFLQKQSQLYLPGAYGVWGSLKYYFTVNNNYVVTRLKMLLLPFWHRDWRRLGTESPDGSKTTQFAPPSQDVNAPDLYIPLMSFITYILLVGYCKGTLEEFSPDVIGEAASYCLVLQLIEIGVMSACLYLLSSSVSFLDLMSFSGYKYVPLVINTLVFQMLGQVAYYLSLLYTGVAGSYFVLNCLKGAVVEPTPERRAFRNYMLFSLSCLQLVLIWWNSYI